MRKFLLSILLFCSWPCFASSTVTIIWPFGVSSTLLNYTRALIHKANQDQTAYKFVLEIKPGAGGSIGAAQTKTIVDNGGLAILASTDAFFVRPMLYPTSTQYKIEDFRLLLPQVATPMALVSRPGADLPTILRQPQSNFGTTGLGTSTHVMAEQIRKRAVQMQIVAYKDPPESVKDVIGGSIDLALENLSLALDNPRIMIHGITGRQKIDGIKNLSDLGFPEMTHLDVKVILVAPANMDVQSFKEIQDVLIISQKNNSHLNSAIKMDRGQIIDLDPKKYDQWFQSQIQAFRNLTLAIKKLD